MRIYVASSWRNKYQPEIIAALRAAGHDAYDFRAPGPGQKGFGWSQIDPNWHSWTPKEWREALMHPIAIQGFLNDKNGMDRSQICVLVLPSGRSSHVEAGYMAAQRKPVYTLALESIEPDLMNLLFGPPSHICVSMEELLSSLALEAA